MPYTKIAENIRLSFKLRAKSIYVSPDGSITITGIIPNGTKIPNLTLEYLETLCYQYYRNKTGQAYSITDALAADGHINFMQSETVRSAIAKNLNEHNITIISII